MKLWWGVTSLRFRFYSFLFYMCFHLTQLIKGVLLDPAATNWSMWGWHNGRSLGRLVAPCYAKDCQLLHLYLWHSILFQTADAAINVLDSMLATSCLIFFWGVANCRNFFNSTMCNHVGPWMSGETARNSPKPQIPMSSCSCACNCQRSSRQAIFNRSEGCKCQKVPKSFPWHKGAGTNKSWLPNFQTILGLDWLEWHRFHMAFKLS